MVYRNNILGLFLTHDRENAKTHQKIEAQSRLDFVLRFLLTAAVFKGQERTVVLKKPTVITLQFDCKPNISYSVKYLIRIFKILAIYRERCNSTITQNAKIQCVKILSGSVQYIYNCIIRSCIKIC